MKRVLMVVVILVAGVWLLGRRGAPAPETYQACQAQIRWQAAPT